MSDFLNTAEDAVANLAKNVRPKDVAIGAGIGLTAGTLWHLLQRNRQKRIDPKDPGSWWWTAEHLLVPTLTGASVAHSLGNFFRDREAAANTATADRPWKQPPPK